MSRYAESMAEVAAAHGGTVERFRGDEVMAVFGVPVTHEDDALRAVRAATEMQRRLALLNAELRERWGAELACRIGINTGEVVAGDPGAGETFVTGDAVNLAKRLEQAAEPGTILIGTKTYSGRTPSGSARASGSPRRGRATPSRASGSTRSMRLQPDTRGASTPRWSAARPNETLRSLVEAAFAERRCRIVTILGPAGIGKSRLTSSCSPSLDGVAATATGRCRRTEAGSPSGRSSSSSRSSAASTRQACSPRPTTALSCWSVFGRRPARPTRPRRGRRCSGRCAASWSGWRSSGRLVVASRTCTGRSRRCSTWSSTSPRLRRGRSCSASHVPELVELRPGLAAASIELSRSPMPIRPSSSRPRRRGRRPPRPDPRQVGGQSVVRRAARGDDGRRSRWPRSSFRGRSTRSWPRGSTASTRPSGACSNGRRSSARSSGRARRRAVRAQRPAFVTGRLLSLVRKGLVAPGRRRSRRGRTGSGTPDMRRGVRRHSEGGASRAARAVRALAPGAGARKGRRRAHGDRRLSPRAGVPLPHRARPGGCGGARARRRSGQPVGEGREARART